MPSIGPDPIAMENDRTEDYYNNWPNDKGVSEVIVRTPELYMLIPV